MDGTLVDSLPYWGNLYKLFLNARGIYEYPPDIAEVLKPTTLEEASAYFLRTFPISGTVEEGVEEMTSIMQKHYETDIPLKPGVVEYLEVMKQRGVHMCVATATATPLVKKCLSRLGVLDYFEFCVSCVDVGAGKGNTLIYDTAVRRLGSTPEETAVFEDAFHAGETVKRAGCHLVAVHDPAAEDEWALLAPIADELIPDWAECARLEAEQSGGGDPV